MHKKTVLPCGINILMHRHRHHAGNDEKKRTIATQNGEVCVGGVGEMERGEGVISVTAPMFRVGDKSTPQSVCGLIIIILRTFRCWQNLRNRENTP